MTFHPSAFIVAVALLHALTSCSQPVHLALDTSNADLESNLSSSTLTTNALPLVGPDAEEAGVPVELASDTKRDNERLLRPELSIDEVALEAVSDALPDGADISFVVVDLERGSLISQRHADRDHIPASSAKLATAVAALQLLGPEHRFLTELRTTGRIEDGVLKGDLILKGGGDPLLDIPDLIPLIDKLARQSVRSIEGRFLIDDSVLPRFTEIEPTQPNEAAYNPGLGALSIAFNRVNVRWRKRGALSVETVPRLDEASFVGAVPDALPPGGVQLKTFDGGEAVWQLADRGARRSKRSLPVKDPGLYAGRIFADLAALHGINLPAPERITENSSSRRIAVHKSRPLRELVRDMLWYSNNLMAELIGLSAARTLEPELASLEASAGIVLSTLSSQLPDTSWDHALLDNHSGLSSKARLSPEHLAAILRYGWQEGMLSSLLPGSGWSGTLAKRFNGPDQAFRIWAKTGSINYVLTLGGYLLSSSHSPAAFVIMISDEKARAAYEAQPRRTRKGEKKAKAWQRGAETAMDQLIERWLEPATEHPSQSLHAQAPANTQDAP